MRVEVRLERDEHEYSVIIECDERTSVKRAMFLAGATMEDLVGPTRLEDLPAYSTRSSSHSRRPANDE